MKFSALTTSLPVDTLEAIRAIADLGFQWIDTPPATTPTVIELLYQRNLKVSCVGLEKEQPDETDVGSEDDALRRRSVDYYRQAIAVTAQLGAPLAYLTPPISTDPDRLKRWTDSFVALGDSAREHGVRVAVEHFPRRALPTVADTLALLESLQHDCLALLIDVGHCLISGEDPATAITDAGEWLGYIHFDDNDGDGDLHWPLLRGVLREEQLVAVLAAQQAVGYQGGLCLELNPTLDEPLENLRQGLEVLRRCARPDDVWVTAGLFDQNRAWHALLHLPSGEVGRAAAGWGRPAKRESS